MMRSLLLVALALAWLPTHASQDAYEIMKNVDERYDGDTMSSVQTLLLLNAKGQKKIRQIKSYSRDDVEDRKSIVFIVKPADVRNIGFLSYRWDSLDQDDDNWLYLPALDRVERLSQSDRSNAFMGSDFSFSDMDGYKLDEWEYRLVSESQVCDGHDCYVIEAVPKKQYFDKLIDETGYERVEHWIRKDIDIVVQSKMYFFNSSKMKLLNVNNIEKVADIWTPHELTMRTYKGKRLQHASVLKIDEIEYNLPLGDLLFTPERLRQGGQ